MHCWKEHQLKRYDFKELADFQKFLFGNPAISLGLIKWVHVHGGEPALLIALGLKYQIKVQVMADLLDVQTERAKMNFDNSEC